jgi:hypothetical protein
MKMKEIAGISVTISLAGSSITTKIDGFDNFLVLIPFIKIQILLSIDSV